MADQRRLYLLISETLGAESKAVESQKVRLILLFYPVAYTDRPGSFVLFSQRVFPLFSCYLGFYEL